MKLLKIVSILLFTTLALYACKKEAGTGGTNTITGKVFATDFNKEYTKIQGEYYIPDYRVYIVYGTENSMYDDDFDTDYNGAYEFNYLRKGTYTIYTYSIDTVEKNYQKLVPIKQTVEITGKNEVIVLPDFKIFTE
ncbi:MAG: hypothetical protein HUU48_08610 [Flavobacteriales bacterium]|nr:hypothetical protein [Flavobacteriales bacterium]